MTNSRVAGDLRHSCDVAVMDILSLCHTDDLLSHSYEITLVPA